MPIRWLSIVLLIPFVAVRATGLEVDEFLKSYREARSRWLSRYERCRVSGVMTETITATDPSIPTQRLVQACEYVRMGDDEKLVLRGPREAMIGGEDKRELYPAGTMIRRGSRLYAVKGPTEEGDYSLAFRGRTDDLPPKSGELEKFRGRFFRPACEAPGFNLPVFLIDLDHPGLSIQSVEPVTRDGESLVRVDYTVRLNDPKPSLQKASCLLNPDWDWSLREFETAYETTYEGVGSFSYSYSGVVDYEPGSGAVPQPQAIHLKYTTPTSVQTTDFSYTRFDFEESSADEFSLAPYGLGEIETPLARPTNRLPYVFGGIAAIALILSIWLRITSRRRGRA